MFLLPLAVYGQNLDSAPQVVHRDTDHNGLEETYTLYAHGRVTVEQEGVCLWESPREWEIKSLSVADADRDGKEELLLVLWKEGSFGRSKPMWRKEPDQGRGNHLFVYRLTAGRMKPVWCSSALDHPILQLQVTDVNGDGQQELEVIEGPPADSRLYVLRQLFCRNRTLWQWQGWGFVRISS